MINRGRRLRLNKTLRDMVRETTISPNDFIYPIFVVEGNNIKEEIIKKSNEEELLKLITSLINEISTNEKLCAKRPITCCIGVSKGYLTNTLDIPIPIKNALARNWVSDKKFLSLFLLSIFILILKMFNSTSTSPVFIVLYYYFLLHNLF